MTRAEWRRVEELIESVLALEPARRAAFLEQACVGDDGLRQEVESLLAYEGRVEQFMPAAALDIDVAGTAGASPAQEDSTRPLLTRASCTQRTELRNG
jgi:hypothetical protein